MCFSLLSFNRWWWRLTLDSRCTFTRLRRPQLMSMKQQHTTHNHTKFHRQTKTLCGSTPKKHRNHPPTLIPPDCFNQKKRKKKKSLKKISLPINGWFIFPQIFAATNGQIFRALKQAVKPSIQSWQNPTSVALNDFGAVWGIGGENGDGWMFWDGS